MNGRLRPFCLLFNPSLYKPLRISEWLLFASFTNFALSKDHLYMYSYLLFTYILLPLFVNNRILLMHIFDLMHCISQSCWCLGIIHVLCNHIFANCLNPNPQYSANGFESGPMPTPWKFLAGSPVIPIDNWVKTKPKLAGNQIPFRGSRFDFV